MDKSDGKQPETCLRDERIPYLPLCVWVEILELIPIGKWWLHLGQWPFAMHAFGTDANQRAGLVLCHICGAGAFSHVSFEVKKQSEIVYPGYPRELHCATDEVKLTCQRRSEPNNNRCGIREDVLHELNLVVLLVDIVLRNAQRVDEEIRDAV